MGPRISVLTPRQNITKGENCLISVGGHSNREHQAERDGGAAGEAQAQLARPGTQGGYAFQ